MAKQETTAVLYARVSDRKQSEQDVSIPTQVEVATRRAEELGARVLRVFVDDAKSAWRENNRPAFEAAIDDWDAHLSKLCDFWSSVLLMTGRFKGSPMQAHAALPDIRKNHFARWLHLFETTVRELCPAPAADLFCARAEMIAQSLQLGIAVNRNELPPAIERAASRRR